MKKNNIYIVFCIIILILSLLLIVRKVLKDDKFGKTNIIQNQVLLNPIQTNTIEDNEANIFISNNMFENNIVSDSLDEIDSKIENTIIDVPKNISTELVNFDKNEIIIGIYDCLMGSFKNNMWYNAAYGNESNELRDKDFYVQDLEEHSKFYVHEYNKPVLEMTDFIDKNEEYYYCIDEDGKIADWHFRFKSSGIRENIQIITNRSENIFVYDMKEIHPSEIHENIVDKVKEERYVSEIDTEITKAIETDYNKDGNKEILLIVNPVRDDIGYVKDEDGACCFVIMIQNQEYKIIYEDIVHKEEIHGVEKEIIIRDVIVCDLNYNGQTDICITAGVWDISKFSIHEYDSETKNFEMELYGTFGW